MCQTSEEICAKLRDIHILSGKNIFVLPHFTNTASLVSTITSIMPLLLYLMILPLDLSQIAGERKYSYIP